MINHLIEKTKNLNIDASQILNRDNIKRAAVTTAVVVIPGSIIVGGAYLIGKKVIASWGNYKKENPQGEFSQWFISQTRQQSCECRSNLGNNIAGIRKKFSPTKTKKSLVSKD